MTAPAMMLDGYTMAINPRGMIARTGMRSERSLRHRYLCQATLASNVTPIMLTDRLSMWVADDGQARGRNLPATALTDRYGHREQVFGMAVICRVDELGDPATLTVDQFAALEATVRDIARWQRRG